MAHMKRLLKSIVWNFFDIDILNPHRCVCKLCHVSVSRGGVNPKTFGTSGMKNHLQYKHKMEYNSEKNKSHLLTSPLIAPRSSSVTCLSHDLSMNCNKASEEITIKNEDELDINSMGLWNVNDHRAVKIHKCLGKMISLDLQPFSIVEDVGFRELINNICPDYEIPCGSYFNQKIIPEMYDHLFQKVGEDISNASFISLAAGSYTANATSVSVVCITGHWISEDDFTRKSAVLKALPLPDSNHCHNINQYLKQVLKSFNIANEKIHIVVRDNSGNIEGGIEDCVFTSIPCFIQNLQFCIGDSVSSQQFVKDILSVCRKVVEHFSHSATPSTKQFAMQDTLGIKKCKFKQTGSIIWSSLYDILKRMLDNKKSLASYASEYNIVNLSSLQWTVVEKLVGILEPFESIEKVFANEKETLSQVIPSILALKLHLHKALLNDSYSGISTIIKEMNKSVQKRLAIFLNCTLLCITSFLDPRFKSTFQNETENTVVGWVEEAWKEMQGNSVPSDLGLESSNKVKSESGPIFTSLMDCFKEIAESKQARSEAERNLKRALDSETLDPKVKRKKVHTLVGLEISSYLSLPLLSIEENPLNWWKNSGNSFPNLKMMALKFLSAPLVSFESKKFKTEENNYEATSNRLSPSIDEKLLFIHYNLKLSQY